MMFLIGLGASDLAPGLMSESAWLGLVLLTLTGLYATYVHRRYGKWWLTILNVPLGFVAVTLVAGLTLALVSP